MELIGFSLSLAISIYLIVLATRLVHAVEKIADLTNLATHLVQSIEKIADKFDAR